MDLEKECLLKVEEEFQQEEEKEVEKLFQLRPFLWSFNLFMEKDKRLRSNRDFRNVYKKGEGYFNRNFTFVVKKNNLPGSRVGFPITKKFGNAVTRNKIKRRLKEIFRLNFDSLIQGYDIVVIPKQNTKELSYEELEKSCMHLIRKISKRVKK